jgi:hypothetical protein
MANFARRPDSDRASAFRAAANATAQAPLARSSKGSGSDAPNRYAMKTGPIIDFELWMNDLGSRYATNRLNAL